MQNNQLKISKRTYEQASVVDILFRNFSVASNKKLKTEMKASNAFKE